MRAIALAQNQILCCWRLYLVLRLFCLRNIFYVFHISSSILSRLLSRKPGNSTVYLRKIEDRLCRYLL